MDGLGGFETTSILENALPVIEESHRILANNVANAHTPGFTPTHVSFKESLRQALNGAGPSLSLKTTHPGHIDTQSRHPSLVLLDETSAPGRNDESKFDIDREMVEILKNRGKHTVLSSILTKRYQQMREVLRIP